MVATASAFNSVQPNLRAQGVGRVPARVSGLIKEGQDHFDGLFQGDDR